MNQAVSSAPLAALSPATLLCVDDEPNILSALRRLFRTHGYKVLTADSGAAGLAVLREQAVDLVISDMRMPGMDGAQFLEQVRAHWPDTVRLLLTGYSDIQSILAAINRGEIFRYITKPWDDNDIALIVRHALERRELERLAQRQNEELRQLNQSLEAKVEARTRDIAQANQKLKANFITTIKILAGMVELRDPAMAGHSRRVADLARRVATRLGLPAQEAQEVFIAGLLLDVGKIGFADDMLRVPPNQLAGDKLGAFRRFPVQGAQLLMPLEEMRGVAAILRAQAERFDGAGFPEGLTGFAIPVGARILALVSDYDNLQLGMLTQRRVPPEEARRLIYDGSGKRYDPAVVNAFKVLLEGEAPESPQDVAVSASQLLPGMVLSRDLVSPEGLMLLSAEHVLDERLIRQLTEFERSCNQRLAIRVWPQRKGSE